MAGLRAVSADAAGDPRLVELVGELSLESEVFRRLWARYDVRPRAGRGTTVLHHPQVGRVELSSASGDLEVGIARGAGVWLDVTSVSGTTSSELAIGEAEPAGGAPIQLVARTLSGDIRLTRAAPTTPEPAPAEPSGRFAGRRLGAVTPFQRGRELSRRHGGGSTNG